MRIAQTSVVDFASQFLSNIFGFLATVFLARVLGASALGTYFLVIAVYLWIQVLLTSGIQSAVFKRLSETSGGSEELGAAAIIQAAILSIAILGILLFSAEVRAYIGADVVGVVILLLIAGSIYGLIQAILKGEKKVHIASLLQPAERIVRVGIQVLLVLAGGGIGALLSGYLAAMIVAGLLGLYFVSTSISLPRGDKYNRIISYAKYAWLSGLSNRTFASTDTLVLGLFVSTTLIGVYEIAWNIASMLAIFGGSVSKAIFPEVSDLSSAREEKRDEVASLINDALAFTGLFTIPGFVGGLVLGEWILGVYGVEFRQGTEVLIILIVARLLAAYQYQFVNSLNAIDCPNIAFRINALFIGGNIALNLVFVYIWDWIGAAVATALAAGVTLVLAYFALNSQLPVSIPFAEIGRQILAATVMGVLIYMMTLILNVTVSVALVLVFVGAVIYFFTLLTISERFKSTVKANIPTPVFSL